MDNIIEVKNKILDIKNKIDSFAEKYKEDVSFYDTIKNIMNNSKFISEKAIEEDFKNKVNLNRVLNIGIIGTVNSGKSSFINSLLFEGKKILPKASTPMTAALTHIQYSDKNYIEVDFITKSDIENCRKINEEFEELINRKISNENSIINVREKLINTCKNIVTENNENYENKIYRKERAIEELKKENDYFKKNYDLYNAILESKKNNKDVYDEVLSNENKIITFENIEEIYNKLEKYVGAGGKYINFVKSLNIYINKEELKNISILDTPGFNDPVESRDRKANELIAKCDVIFILMSSLELFSAEDKKIITKTIRGNGIYEIYIIISKFDSALNSISNLDKYRGNLEECVNSKLSHFSNYIEENLSEIKKEIENKKLFENIIYDIENRIIHTCSMADSIILNWNNLKNYKEENNTFNLLSENYPSYFDINNKDNSINNLKYINDIGKVKKVMEKISENKYAILEKMLTTFEESYIDDASEIKEKLLEYAKDRERELDNKDLKTISEKYDQLKDLYLILKKELKTAADETIYDWKIQALENGKAILTDFFNKVESEKSLAEGEIVRKEGFPFFKKDVVYSTVSTHYINNALNKYKNNFNEQMKITLPNIYKNMRDMITEKLFEVFKRENIKDVRKYEINRSINAILYEYSIKEVSYSKEINIDINFFGIITGKLEGGLADMFINKANKILQEMREYFFESFQKNINSFYDEIRKIDFAYETLERKLSELDMTKSELENIKETEIKWDGIKKEIRNLFSFQ